jgi:hypothetical protein
MTKYSFEVLASFLEISSWRIPYSFLAASFMHLDFGQGIAQTRWWIGISRICNICKWEGALYPFVDIQRVAQSWDEPV